MSRGEKGAAAALETPEKPVGLEPGTLTCGGCLARGPCDGAGGFSLPAQRGAIPVLWSRLFGAESAHWWVAPFYSGPAPCATSPPAFNEPSLRLFLCALCMGLCGLGRPGPGFPSQPCASVARRTVCCSQVPPALSWHCRPAPLVLSMGQPAWRPHWKQPGGGGGRPELSRFLSKGWSGSAPRGCWGALAHLPVLLAMAPAGMGEQGVPTQGCVGAWSHRRSSGRAERLLLGRMMEEEDYDKHYYQRVLSPTLFFFFF